MTDEVGDRLTATVETAVCPTCGGGLTHVKQVDLSVAPHARFDEDVYVARLQQLRRCREHGQFFVIAISVHEAKQEHALRPITELKPEHTYGLDHSELVGGVMLGVASDKAYT